MSSIGIATLGMFDQGVGGNIIQTAGGVIHVDNAKPKPQIKLISITTEEQTSKKKIEVTSIKLGD